MRRADVATVMWKEWKMFKDQLGWESSRMGTAVVVFLFAALSCFGAYRAGPGWLASPAMLLIYPFTAAAIAIQPIVDSFAGERERHTLETLLASRLSDSSILFGKILGAALPAIAFALVMFGLAILAVNVFHGAGHILLPPTSLLVGTVLLIVGMTGLVGTGGVFVSLRASTVRQATQTFGLVLAGVLVLPVVVVMLLPALLQDEFLAWVRTTNLLRLTLTVCTGIIAVDVLFLIAALKRFRRGRLILD
jgi:ABC-2 type transport system permease protein